MATTEPFSFAGLTATIDADKVAEIVEAYEEAQGDEDKADSPEDGAWYEGQKAAYLHVLNLLHGTKFGHPETEPKQPGLDIDYEHESALRHEAAREAAALADQENGTNV